MLTWFNLLASIFLVIITLLPYIPMSHGLVRIFDFPRIQIAVLAWFCRKVWRCITIVNLSNLFDLSSILSDKDDFMISFKGSHYPKDIILYAVFFYVRYAVSYRDLEEIMAERGVKVDHATLNRWVVKFSPLIAREAQRRKSATSNSWRMDETYIKIKGKWNYYYRAVDKGGKTLDFMLSEQRNAKAARRFFKQAIDNHGVPNKVVIDKSGANLAGLHWTNVMLKLTKGRNLIKILQAKYLNNIMEQDHRFIKRLTHPMMGFKSIHSASATLKGIEVAHMIRKHQFGNDNKSPFQLFAALAG